MFISDLGPKFEFLVLQKFSFRSETDAVWLSKIVGCDFWRSANGTRRNAVKGEMKQNSKVPLAFCGVPGNRLPPLSQSDSFGTKALVLQRSWSSEQVSSKVVTQMHKIGIASAYFTACYVNILMLNDMKQVDPCLNLVVIVFFLPM